ncbi:hypothetical protein L226DRAFT_188392 [Lentinus tigrinus ALCF2SS1-7]|uniref:uncharacterized protein n=1 Tax=Lentinus tigrinus ALCF2SS1-7 TaxID=1328758 RepID=UPI001165CCF8|nr:hypothetical protein L226DRAFT_188392 [Lentinus tigrinus ALCF2SS1-7]
MVRDSDSVLRKIPRPKKPSTFLRPSQQHGSLASQMRLSGSPETLKIYCEIVAKVAQVIDQNKPPTSSQNPDEWSRFIGRVVKECPILVKYEDAWPVRVIYRRYRGRPNKPGGLADWTKYINTKHVQDATGHTPRPPSAHTAEQSQSHPDSVVSTASVSNTEPATGQLGLARSILKELSAKATNAPYEQTPLTQLASTLTVTPQNAPILAFLRTLVPEQTTLLPVFIYMGITDDAALLGLARMKDRDEWVYSWTQRKLITELQFVAIMAGLRAIHNTPPASSTLI